MRGVHGWSVQHTPITKSYPMASMEDALNAGKRYTVFPWQLNVPSWSSLWQQLLPIQGILYVPASSGLL